MPDTALRALLREHFEELLAKLSKVDDHRPHQDRPPLSPKAQDLRDAATSEPQSIERLAKAAGWTMNSDTERIVTMLVDCGELIRVSRGLRSPW